MLRALPRAKETFTLRVFLLSEERLYSLFEVHTAAI